MSSSANSERPSAIAGPSAASSDDMSSPWQSLHADLLQLISWRVLAGDLLDYIRFRAVCTQWRSSNVSPRGRGIVDPRFHPRRWMLLPEGHGLHPGDGNKTFFNLSTGVSVHARLMLSSGCCILDSAEGLLLVQWGTQDHDKVRLLHPFTGDFVELPPLMYLVRMHLNMTDGTRRRRRRPECVDFRSATSITVTEGGLITAMIMINHVSSVFFATTKDRQWSVSTWSIAPYSSSIAFQGKFYMLVSPTIHGSEQQILRLDPPGHEHEAMSSSSLLLLPPELVGTCPTDKIRGQFTIAECDSEILVIVFDTKKKSKSRMLVYRLSNLAKGEVVPVTSIGSNILFLDSIGNGSSSIRVDDDDDIFVHVRKNMVVSYNAILAIEGNTVVRRGRLKDNNPWRYDLGSGKRSLTPTFIISTVAVIVLNIM